MNLNAIGSSIFYHILTIMAMQAGQGKKSLHSILIRLWQSWALSMVVLKVFDFSKIQMFSWGQEAARIKAQAALGAAMGSKLTINASDLVSDDALNETFNDTTSG